LGEKEIALKDATLKVFSTFGMLIAIPFLQVDAKTNFTTTSQ
jgi:hypothetical protein